MSTPMIRQRPAGVTILAILEMLGGVMVFLLGILIFSLVELAKATFAPEMGVLAGVTMGVVGGFFLVIGLIGIGLGYGLWRGMGWAWTAGLIFAVLGALGGLLALPYGIAGLLIEVAILYYLTRPHVKLYFGK